MAGGTPHRPSPGGEGWGERSPQENLRNLGGGNAGGNAGGNGGRTVRSMSVFTDLDAQWERISTTPAAARSRTAWATSEPSLAPYESPAALVEAITSPRGAPRSAGLLGALVRLSGDPFAARTALQAVLPALRAQPILQPRYGYAWWEPCATADDVTADLVAAAWEAIRAHAGESHDDPERLVVRAALRRLRTAREAHVRRLRATVSYDPGRHDHGVELDQARTAAERVTLLLIDAVRAGRLEAGQARLLYATSVAGIKAIKVAALAGMPEPRAVYHALETAQAALATAQAPLAAARAFTATPA